MEHAALWPRTGTGTIARGVLRHIAASDPCHRYFAYFDRSPDPWSAQWPGIRVAHGGPRHKLLWANTWLLYRLWRDQIDVYVTFLDKEMPFLPTRARVACMIHDLIPLRFPDVVFRNAAHRVYYTTFIKAASRRADLILTNSEFSRSEIVSELRVSESKVQPITLGVDAPPSWSAEPSAQVLQRYQLARPYVLSLGSTEPRKNNRRVIEAMRLLSQQHSGPLLAIAGSPWRGAAFAPEPQDDRVRLLGHVPDEDLPVLFANAELLAFPSFYEGFGFPVIEAMAAGVPVVTSNVTALPEVAGTRRSTPIRTTRTPSPCRWIESSPILLWQITCASAVAIVPECSPGKKDARNWLRCVNRWSGLR